ncbi:P-type conjugative transfer ATPase TrbB [Achromobacter xylosoxidans]|jgi:type IV secretion system protein VirB11|uniref:P-type conjugative transfer ATPase TrbB n=1 Tax=Alcaligenes xylosoxydans xylosoxydans TaxID=85698 RepID=UPI001F13E5D8|nr:P-type conjugative transfer ATPase TrbB [Achromobacter xylosoxidans]
MTESDPTRDAAHTRSVQMLRTALGPAITEALDDPGVAEVMLNPDGRLWLDRLDGGRAPTGVSVSAADAERIIRLVAACVRAEVHRERPLLSARLPLRGERFEGVLPPVTYAPAFSIRKHAVGIFTLDDYVRDGILAPAHAAFLRAAVRERMNVVVAGGTSSGKTTFANALLDLIADSGDRILILEDTPELQCRNEDRVLLCTLPGVASMADLVRSTLRQRPDRIIVGEVRGAEALDLLKAWGTGHPGGIATLHANSAVGALLRLEQLTLEAASVPPRALIAEAVNVIVFLSGRGQSRRVKEIVGVTGLDGETYRLTPISTSPATGGTP